MEGEREMPTSDSGIETIEEVLEALDTIIARALDEGSRVGYFAAVYRVVTQDCGGDRHRVLRRRRADAAA
jgi:hypothetical protein